MEQLPPDDQRLSSFLRRYRPAPPKTPSDLEDYLLTRIECDTHSRSKGTFWILSSAVVAGIIMGWGVYRYSNQPTLTVSTPELEHFVLESWDMGTNETADFNNSPSLTNDWQILTNPNNSYLVSKPH